MTKKLVSAILIFTVFMAMMVPTGLVMADDRNTYMAVEDATKLKGTKGQNMNVYGIQLYAGPNCGGVYNVYVPVAKKYDIVARMASNNNARVTASVNGALVDAVQFDTGDTTNYQEILLNSVEFRAGYSTVDITVLEGSVWFTHLYIDESTGKKVELDLTKKSGTFKNHWLPTVIEAEDFDFDSAYSASVAAVMKQNYRKDSPLEIKVDGFNTIVAMNNGDTITHTFNVPQNGIFDISAVASTSGKVRLYFDDNPGYVEGTLESFTESSLGAVSLTRGTHSICIESRSDDLNLDKIRFKTSDGTSNYVKPSDLTEGTCVLIETKEEVKVENPVWKEFYVSPDGSDTAAGTKESPFKTITAAKEAVKEISKDMKGDIVINFLPGVHKIDNTIKFDIDDSGKNGYNIVYRGTDSENKPILSGGRTITGWEKIDDKIWSAKVDDDIEMVRQLYINTLPARIARSKYTYRGIRPYDDQMTEFEEDGFYVKKKNFPVLTNTDSVEVVFQFMWALHYFPVKSITDVGEEWLVEYDSPYYGRYLQGAASHSTPTSGIEVWFANAPELIDEPGEFWFDKNTKTVYYYPFEEEDMTTAEVYTPQTEFLMTLNGNNKDNKISNIVFDNLDIRHGAWNDIARTGIFVGQGDSKIPPDTANTSSSETWQRDKVPAQIEINFADNISVTNCNFINLGSSALAMRNCVTNSRVDGNYFRDTAGSAIVIGDTNYNSDTSTVEDVSRNISVKNNVIRRIGHDLMGSVGIMIFYANSVDAMHNDIKYVPYTGISIGWGWGSRLSDTLRSGEHMIANNRIDHSSQAVYDGGAIYTLSSMKGMYIQGNHLSNSPDSGGIYFDQGSQNITARDNVLEDNKKNSLYAGRLIEDVYRNYANYLDNGTSAPWNYTDVSKNVREKVIRVDGDNWPKAARDIMANAGLQTEYKHLLDRPMTELPSWRDMSIRLLKKGAFKSDTEVMVHASNWIPGGEGVAFHEINDKEPEDYGMKDSFIGNTYEGEWVKYNMPIKTAGNYIFNIYYALNFSGDEANATDWSGVTIYIDGVKICNNIRLSGTGSWNSYVPLPVAEVEFTEGDHEVKVEFSKGAFALGKIEAINSDFVGSDVNYDDGTIFKLPN